MKDGSSLQEGDNNKQHQDSIKDEKKRLVEQFIANIKKYKEKLREEHNSEPTIEENLILKTHSNDNHPQKQNAPSKQQFWKMFLFIFTQYKQSPLELTKSNFGIIYKQMFSVLKWKQYQTQNQGITKKPQQTNQTHTITEDNLDLKITPSSPQQQQLSQRNQPLPQISNELKQQLIKQISLIQNIVNLQFLLNLYTYLNISEFVTNNKLLDQYVICMMEKKLEELMTERFAVDWNKEQNIDKNQSQEQSLIPTKPPTQPQLKQQLSDNPKRENIFLFIRHKFELNSFFAYLFNGKSHQAQKPIKMFNCFSRFISFRLNLEQIDINIYLHPIHRIAEKKKRFLIANILHSKCFICTTERFKSSSIHQVRIYQKFMKKFNNILINEIPTF